MATKQHFLNVKNLQNTAPKASILLLSGKTKWRNKLPSNKYGTIDRVTEDCATRPFFLALRECARRVAKKAAYTAETCHQETVELMEAIDRCVKDKAFVKLL